MLSIQDPIAQATMQVGYADCDSCGHCSDLHIPTDDQAASLTQVQADIADAVAFWISEAEAKRQQAKSLYEAGSDAVEAFLQ